MNKDDSFKLPQTIQPHDSGRLHINHREEAANVVRGQINAIYRQNPPHQTTEQEYKDRGAPYDRTLNSEMPRPEQEAWWHHYHSAWQSYYQQYYHRFYLQQLHTQRQQKMLGKVEPADAKPAESNYEQASPAQHSQFSTIRQIILKKVGERAKKFRRSHHFVPVTSALAVGIVILFLQYNRFLFADVQACISPGSSVNVSDTILVDPTANLNVGTDPKLIIPKINVNTRVVYNIGSVSEDAVQAGLRKGVVHYTLPGADSLPGQVGNTVLLGHSSNDIFDPGESKFVFVLLERMQPNDIFYVHYNGKRYIYRVTDKRVIKPTDIEALQIDTGKPLVTLVTCTPLGTDLNRLLVIGEQITPDPNTATQGTPQADTSKPAEVPGGERSIIEKLFSWL